MDEPPLSGSRLFKYSGGVLLPPEDDGPRTTIFCVVNAAAYTTLLPTAPVATKRNNVSKRPPGRYDVAGVKRHPRAFNVIKGRFLFKKTTFWSPRAIKKKKKAHTSHTHTASALANV